MYRASLSALVTLLVAASLVVKTHGSWGSKSPGGLWRKRTTEPPAAPPGAFLFHQGGQPLSWDNDELSRIRQLHSRNFHDAQEYSKHKNLADYLGLSQIQGLHMPIPINIVLVGFQGDGNMGANVQPDVLNTWFSAIDTVLPHTRISLSELSCSEEGHCAGQMEGVLAPSPLVSSVHLNFSANVVVLQQGLVLGVFERAITAFSRPQDPADETGHQQVDALKVEALVQSFVDSLGLSDAGYSFLVINPHWSTTAPGYGYRVGFSEPELTLLGDQMESLQKLAAQLTEPEPRPPSTPRGAGWARYRGGRRRSNVKFSVQDLASESSVWCAQMETYLASEEEHRRKVLRLLGPRSQGALAVRRAVELLRRHEESDLGSLVAATLGMSPEHVHNTRFRASHPLEDCPTPAWVGHGRWLLLDLTAYRTDWGPALGGEGVVTHETLPDVNYAFHDAEVARANAREARAEADPSHAFLKEELEKMQTQRLAALANRQQHAAQMHAARMVHGRAPGAPGSEEQPADNDSGMKDIEHRHKAAMLQAELDVHEEFALRHCQGRSDPPVVCADMKDHVTDLRQELAALMQHSVLPMSAHRHHGWNIFGASDADDTPGSEAEQEHQRAVDAFLAELTAVLSRALGHVVVPPTATWPHHGYLHDSASPYTHTVHFSVYTIGDTSREKRNAAVGDAAASFDVNVFADQLSRLALPTQTFTYAQHSYNLVDDPQLAAAFAVSMRTSFAEVPHAVSDPVGNELLFLDSRELAARLRQRFPTAPRRATHADPHQMLEVPVFLFSLDRDVPVLIDEVYNARALEDMVLIVTNAAHQDEHPIGMMCDGVLLSRPLSPIKHALAATLQHLGGVLPPHLGYTPGRHQITHDWLWSVGAHPLSSTSFGSSFSQIHIDALHRTYILDAIDASAESVNRGIALLQHQDTASTPHKHVQRAVPQMRKALQRFSQLVGLWRTTMSHASNLEYPAAVELTVQIEKVASEFEAECHAIFGELYHKSCAARNALPAEVLGAILFGSALTAVVALLIAFAPRRKAKRI